MTQRETQRPVKFEITEQTRDAIGAWMVEAGLRSEDYLFPSRRRPRNVGAVRMLLGHTKIESTVRYLGVEVDAALWRS